MSKPVPPPDRNVVADAIDIIHSVVIVAGHKEPSSMQEQIMRRIVLNGPVHMRVFQKHGISSRAVAVALRDGLLDVQEGRSS